MAALVTGTLGASYILGMAVYVVSAFLQTGRFLDQSCVSMGLISKSYLLFGRQCHGELAGRIPGAILATQESMVTSTSSQADGGAIPAMLS